MIREFTNGDGITIRDGDIIRVITGCPRDGYNKKSIVRIEWHIYKFVSVYHQGEDEGDEARCCGDESIIDLLAGCAYNEHHLGVFEIIGNIYDKKKSE